jgi:hypothetical protein
MCGEDRSGRAPTCTRARTHWSEHFVARGPVRWLFKLFGIASVHFRRPHSHSPPPSPRVLCLSPPTGDFSSAAAGDLARRESHIQGVIAHRGEHTLPPWAVYYSRKCTDEHLVRFFPTDRGFDSAVEWSKKGECSASSLHIEPFVPGILPDTNRPYPLYRRTCIQMMLQTSCSSSSSTLSARSLLNLVHNNGTTNGQPWTTTAPTHA